MMHGATWICNDCGETFDVPKKTHEGGYPEEPTYECPHCGSDDYQLAEYCTECECVFPQSDLKYGICEDCLRALAHERGHEFITSDEDSFDDFAFFMHKRMRDRNEVST